MPLYEYECDQCESRFELIRRFADPPLEACPTCGGGVRKLLSSPAIQFKGTGWYVTDYARKEAKADASGERPPEKAEKKQGDATGKSKAKAEKGQSASSSSDSGKSRSSTGGSGTSPTSGSSD